MLNRKAITLKGFLAGLALSVASATQSAPIVVSANFDTTLVNQQTLTAESSIDNSGVTGSGTLTLPGFDASLGQLTDATIEFVYETVRAASIISSGSSTGSPQATLLGYEGFFSLSLPGNPGIGFGSRVLGDPLACVAGADSGLACPALSLPGPSSPVTEGPISLAAILDELQSDILLDFSASLGANSLVLNAGPDTEFQVSSAITWRGSATIRYTFAPHEVEPSPVPTPPPFALLTVALIGLAIGRLRRRT